MTLITFESVEYLYAVCLYAEHCNFLNVMLSVVMLSVIILSLIMLSVVIVMLSVVQPVCQYQNRV